MPKLPPGCRFWIWPQYKLEFEGRIVTLPPTEGEVLMILLANPGKRMSREDLAEERYAHREDGGPLYAAELQKRHVHYLRRRLKDHGIDVHITSFRGSGGFIFRGFSLRESAEQVAVPAVDLMEAA